MFMREWIFHFFMFVVTPLVAYVIYRRERRKYKMINSLVRFAQIVIYIWLGLICIGFVLTILDVFIFKIYLR